MNFLAYSLRELKYLKLNNAQREECLWNAPLHNQPHTNTHLGKPKKKYTREILLPEISS